MKESFRELEKAKIITRRTADAYRSHQRRSLQAQATLDYSLADLRVLVRQHIDQPCPYCSERITARNFACDHRQPTSRAGTFSMTNLAICCKRCNEIKGRLTADEYHNLLNLLQGYLPEARRNLLARLRAGGRFLRG